VLDNLKFQLFSPDWSAKDELLLLQGITKCGMGNWIDISEQYIKTKTPEECEEHYFTFYYKSKQDSLPTEKDCIITGSRLIHNGNIKIPIDESKALESEKRRKAFQVKKDKDTQQEEEELAQRQLAHQNFMNNQSA